MTTQDPTLQELLRFSPNIEEDYNEIVSDVIDAYSVLVSRFVQHLYDKELIINNDTNETFKIVNTRLHNFFIKYGIEFIYSGGRKVMTFNHNISTYKMYYSIDEEKIVIDRSVPGNSVKLISASFVIARFVKDIHNVIELVDEAIEELQQAERVSDNVDPIDNFEVILGAAEIADISQGLEHHEEHYEEEQHHAQEPYDEDRPF